eukprot:COSAG06_NODE_7050_length_2656_cov_29.276588_2_plen_110_part_00
MGPGDRALTLRQWVPQPRRFVGLRVFVGIFKVRGTSPSMGLVCLHQYTIMSCRHAMSGGGAAGPPGHRGCCRDSHLGGPSHRHPAAATYMPTSRDTHATRASVVLYGDT